MRHADQYGLPLTTASAAAADAFVEGLDLFLRGRVEATERFSVALGHDPDFALPRAALAYQLQFKSDPSAALGQILVAARHGKHATRREQSLTEALRRALFGDHPTACGLMVRHLEEFPRDVLIIRELALLRRYSGDSRDRTLLAEELGHLAPSFAADPWFMAAQSFILSECGEIDAARGLAERALALRPDHGSAAHSLAHAYFEANEDREGLEFLSGWLSEHSESSVGAGHLTWHSALCALALSDFEHAWNLYRDRTSSPSGALQLEDAVSVLWRLQLRGFDVASEWASVLEREPPAGPGRAFALAHLGFASAAIGDVDALRDLKTRALDEAAKHPHQPFRFLTPLLDALVFFAREQWTDAARALEDAVVDARRLGGSNEQHTLYDETLAVAYRRAGRDRDARRLERVQLHGRPVETLAS